MCWGNSAVRHDCRLPFIRPVGDSFYPLFYTSGNIPIEQFPPHTRAMRVCASGLRPLEPERGSEDLPAHGSFLSSSTQHCNLYFSWRRGSFWPMFLYVLCITKSRAKRTDEQAAILRTVGWAGVATPPQAFPVLPCEPPSRGAVRAAS